MNEKSTVHTDASTTHITSRKLWHAPDLIELRTEETATESSTGNDGNGSLTAFAS
jgi:hypothetical protein